MPTYDKLSVINAALIATGSNPVATDDGSPEWTMGSAAYDRALPLILYKGNWTFQTKTSTALARLGASAYPGYTDIYQKPIDCLHIENAWRTDLGPLVVQSSGFDQYGMGAMPPPLDYKIIGDQIHCTGPNGVSCLYVAIPEPYGQSGVWPPGFFEALTRQVESYLYQSFEDFDGAEKTGKIAEMELAEARAKVDAEQPRRVAFRSRFLELRRRSKVGWWM
jgi:hypothetical protein